MKSRVDTGAWWFIEVCTGCKRRVAGYCVASDLPYKKLADIPALRPCLFCKKPTRLRVDGATEKQSNVILVLLRAARPLKSDQISLKAHAGIGTVRKVLRLLLDKHIVKKTVHWRDNMSYTALYSIREAKP